MDVCVYHMTWRNKSLKPAMSMHILASKKPCKVSTKSILVHIN